MTYIMTDLDCTLPDAFWRLGTSEVMLKPERWIIQAGTCTYLTTLYILTTLLWVLSYSTNDT